MTMASVFPGNLLASVALPLDSKFLHDTLPTAAVLPLALRYKGMIICVRGAVGNPPRYYRLNSDDLSLWTELSFDSIQTITIDDWQSATEYKINQPIARDGQLFRSLLNHTSASTFAADAAKWQLISGLTSVTTDSETIIGAGTSISPLTVQVSADADNQLEARADGLYAHETDISGKVDKVTAASRIYGTTAGGAQTVYHLADLENVQPDWDQATSSEHDYIRNKPDIPSIEPSTDANNAYELGSDDQPFVDISGKVDKAQGSANAGKFLGIDVSGNVVPAIITQNATVVDDITIIGDGSALTPLAVQVSEELDNILIVETDGLYVGAIDVGVESVTGTTDQITVDNTDPANPVIGLASTITTRLDQLWDRIFGSNPPDPPSPSDPDVQITNGVIPNSITPSIIRNPDFTVSTSQWTGAISWSPSVTAGVPFAAETIYTASIVITPRTGFTLEDVDSSTFFTIDIPGVNPVWNPATSTVLIIFPETEEEPTTDSWELTYSFPSGFTAFTFSHNGKIPLANWTGFDGTQVLTDTLYDAPSMGDMPVELYAKYVTDANWKLIPFDNWTNPNLGSNAISEWGFDSMSGGPAGSVYISGSNSTGSNISLKLIQL